jgi:hypothetical protein
MTRATPPTPCYAVEGLPPKKGGAALYESLRTAVARGDATLVEALTIPPKDARTLATHTSTAPYVHRGGLRPND